MKTTIKMITLVVVLIIWIISTMIMTVSLIGLVPLIMLYNETDYFDIPQRVVARIIEM